MGLSVILATTGNSDSAKGAKPSREASGFFNIISGELTASASLSNMTASGRREQENHQATKEGFVAVPASDAGGRASIEQVANLADKLSQKDESAIEVSAASRRVAGEGREEAGNPPLADGAEDTERDGVVDETSAVAGNDDSEEVNTASETAAMLQAESAKAAAAALALDGGEAENRAADGEGDATGVEGAAAVEPKARGWQGQSQPMVEAAEGDGAAQSVSGGAAEGGIAKDGPSLAPGVYVEAKSGSEGASPVDGVLVASQAASAGSPDDSAEAEAFLAAVAEAREAAEPASPALNNRQEEIATDGTEEGAIALADDSAREPLAAAAGEVEEADVEPGEGRRGSGGQHGGKYHSVAVKSGWKLWGREQAARSASPSTSREESVAPKMATPEIPVPKPAQAAPEAGVGRTGGGPVKAEPTGEHKEPTVSAGAKYETAQVGEGIDSPGNATAHGIAPEKASEGQTVAGAPVSARGAEQADEVAAKVPARAEPQEETRAAREVFRQVQGGLRVAFLQRGEKAVIQLMPEALGRVQVALSRTSQGLTASFRVETVEARDALSSQIVQLKGNFESRGVNLVSVNVDLGNDKSMSNGGHADPKRNQRRQAAHLGALEADNTLTAKESSWKPWGFETRA